MATMTIDGCTIHYQVLGQQGVPIALTPGGRAQGDAVMVLATRLAQHHRVLLWDRRNTGASDVFIGGEGSEQEIWADDMARLLKHLGWAPCYVGGGSGGCRVSVLTGIRHPEVVKGLLLWSASGGPYGSTYLAHQYHVPYVTAAERGGMAAVAETPFFAERIAANPSNRARLLAMDPEEFVRVMKRWLTFFIYREDMPLVGATAAELRGLKMPVLLFEGNDDIHPKEVTDAMAPLIPNVEVAENPWSGEEFMGRFTGKTPGSLMADLYPRMAPRILAWVAKTEAKLAAAGTPRR